MAGVKNELVTFQATSSRLLISNLLNFFGRGEFLEQMLGKDYQVLDIDYAVAERRRADYHINKRAGNVSNCQPFSHIGRLVSSAYGPAISICSSGALDGEPS